MLQKVNHRCSLHVSPQGSLQQWEPAVERRVSDLKLDSDKSTGRDGDSRPSSGFYSLSDACSVSLSNSCNSVASEHFVATFRPGEPPGSHASSTHHSEPNVGCNSQAAASSFTAQEHPQSAINLSWVSLMGGDRDRGRTHTSGDACRAACLKPRDWSSHDGGEPPARFCCDLRSRDCTEVYRYPSPLHVVALQSSLFLQAEGITMDDSEESWMPKPTSTKPRKAQTSPRVHKERASAYIAALLSHRGNVVPNRSKDVFGRRLVTSLNVRHRLPGQSQALFEPRGLFGSTTSLTSARPSLTSTLPTQTRPASVDLSDLFPLPLRGPQKLVSNMVPMRPAAYLRNVRSSSVCSQVRENIQQRVGGEIPQGSSWQQGRPGQFLYEPRLAKIRQLVKSSVLVEPEDNSDNDADDDEDEEEEGNRGGARCRRGKPKKQRFRDRMEAVRQSFRFPGAAAVRRRRSRRTQSVMDVSRQKGSTARIEVGQVRPCEEPGNHVRVHSGSQGRRWRSSLEVGRDDGSLISGSQPWPVLYDYRGAVSPSHPVIAEISEDDFGECRAGGLGDAESSLSELEDVDWPSGEILPQGSLVKAVSSSLKQKVLQLHCDAQKITTIV
uniref:Uncharacterized protein n=1 Tax=Eptatretus burgeri TaxID=7764 RepID=A0A8C4QDF8_EPTBU